MSRAASALKLTSEIPSSLDTWTVPGIALVIMVDADAQDLAVNPHSGLWYVSHLNLTLLKPKLNCVALSDNNHGIIRGIQRHAPIMASVSRGFPRLSPPHARFSVAETFIFSANRLVLQKNVSFCFIRGVAPNPRRHFENVGQTTTAQTAQARFTCYSPQVSSHRGDDSARHCASVSSETSSADERRSADCMDMSSGSCGFRPWVACV